MTDPYAPGKSLAKLAQERLDELGISARQAVIQSDYAISTEWLYRLLKGRHSGFLTTESAENIAKVLRCPVERVWEAAGRQAPEPWQFPKRYEALEPWARDLVEQMAAGLLKASQGKS